MKKGYIETHQRTLNAWWDLIPTDKNYLIKYNAYRKALVNTGFKISITSEGLHQVKEMKGVKINE